MGREKNKVYFCGMGKTDVADKDTQDVRISGVPLKTVVAIEKQARKAGLSKSALLKTLLAREFKLPEPQG